MRILKIIDFDIMNDGVNISGYGWRRIQWKGNAGFITINGKIGRVNLNEREVYL